MWLKEFYTNGLIEEESYIQRRKEVFRDLRKQVFKAFDIWERAVLRGREDDDLEVMTWYQDMLDFPDLITEETTAEDYPKLPKVLEKYL